MKNWILKCAQKLLLLATLAVLGGLLCATMVRFTPGYGLDERALNSSLSSESRAAIRAELRHGNSVLSFYLNYLRDFLGGNFGNSAFLEQPVSLLLKQRAPFTIRAVILGLLTAWPAATALSLLVIRFPHWFLDLIATASTGFLIALPVGVVALSCVYLRLPVFVGIAAVTLPKLFRYQHSLFAHAAEQPFVFAARSRGISSNRIVICHIVPLSWQPLLALLGVSSALALGSAIPLEAFTDSPGLGQLAWQAALNRDLPLLTTLTVFVTLFTVAVNSFAGAFLERST